jgi:hypothetical protein
VRFPYGATREKGILELVHSDGFFPVSVPSLGGSLYYVSLIDDFSRKTWIYFLRKKAKVFEKFKDFKCWLWSLIMFLIQRFLLLAVFIPHEDFTPQKYVYSSTRGSAWGGYPLCGVWGAYPPDWGVRGRSPQRKNCLVNVYCNFIVNLDRSL